MSGTLSDIGGFAKGFGEGLWGGAKGMVQGLGSLAEGAYNIATDPNARTQAWNDAVNAAQTAEWAVENPSQAASAVGQGATNLYNNFVTAEQQAVANGQGAQFWGNLAGQATFAAGTVLVPGLAEGKIAGALGEAGDASQALRAATTLEEAAPALSDAAATATRLPDPAALSFVPENSGVAQSAAGQAWRDYQAQTLGADTNALTGESNVPALQFDNPNPNGNPFVKWDGFQQLPDGTTELIDAKTAIAPFSTADGPFIPQSTLDQLVNKSAALDQNPGYSGVIEVPTQQAATDAQAALDQLGITNIDVRLRPFQDATTGIPDAAATDASTVAAPDLTPGNPVTDPTATGAMSFPNTGNLIGAGLLGAGALGNVLSPSSQPDPTAAANPDTTPLFSATYGVNPDGSLTTLSPPTLVSPGDGSVAPPQPIISPPVDTAPVTPPPVPVDAAPVVPSPAPVDTAPVVPSPAPVDTAPVAPSPAPVDTAPVALPPAPVDVAPVIPPPAPADIAPVTPLPMPVDTAPVIPPPAPVDIAPVIPPPAPVDIAPVTPLPVPPPVDVSPTLTPDPTISDPTLTDPIATDPTISDPTISDPAVSDPTMGDISGIGGGGGGGMDAMAAMADD